MLNSLPIFYFTSQRCLHWWVQWNFENHFNPKANKGGMQGKHSGHKDMFKYISLRALDTHSYQGILTHPNFAANTPRLWRWKRVNCIFEFRRKQHTHTCVNSLWNNSSHRAQRSAKDFIKNQHNQPFKHELILLW